MSKPYFSVVISTYNRAQLIVETLDTVLDQNFKDYEIIIVDNASTDNTVEVLKDYLHNSSINLIINKENLERSKARNIGIESATGEYVTFLDSDDFMYSVALKEAFDFSSKHPKVKFFHSRYELVDNERRLLRSYDFPAEKNFIKGLAVGNFISCIGVYLHREVYQKYRFNEDEKVIGSEDWELWVRIISEHELFHLPKVCFGIRQHPNRSISAYDLDSIASRKEYILEHLFKNQKVVETFAPFKSLMRSSSLIFTAVICNSTQRFDKAKIYLWKAFKIKPDIVLSRRFLRVLQIAIFKLNKQ